MATLTAGDLENIQGFALSGYGHLPHSRFVFLEVEDATTARRWLNEMIPLTTTARPYPVLPNGKKQKPDTALNLSITYEGLAALRLPRETLDSFPQEFVEGPAKRSDVLGDVGESSPEHWQWGGPDASGIHLMLLLYAESAVKVEEFLAAQRTLLGEYRNGLREIWVEEGHRLPADKEHFGFHDGIAQPDIEGVQRGEKGLDGNEIKLGELLFGYQNGYGMYAPSPTVLTVHDPNHLLPEFPGNALPHCRDLGRDGTFLVYRKLKQDVAGFWQFVQQHAGEGSPEMLSLATKFIGRWPSGAPVTLSPGGDNPALASEDNFGFTALDAEGHRCPVGAHMRRANPRDSLLNDTPSHSYLTCSRHRIVRRGIDYGEPLYPLEMTNDGVAPANLQGDGQPRGIHFLALNASISRQFEFIQQTWCNSTFFQALFNEKDAIIGDNDGTADMSIQGVPYRRRIAGLPRFVSVTGAAYLFLPGISALRYLAS